MNHANTAPTTGVPAKELFRPGDGVSFWLGPDGLGQVEYVHRTRVDVLYPRDGRVCRRRVSAHRLAIYQDTRPLLFRCFNPLNRAVTSPSAKGER